MKGNITYKNNKLVAIITLPKDIVTGKYPQKQLNALPYETVKELEIRMNRFIDQMRSHDIRDFKRLTLGNYLNQWLDSRKNSIEQSTYDGYYRYINNHIVKKIGNTILSKLKPIDIASFYDYELNTYANKTVTQIHRILRKALEDAYKNKLTFDNLGELIEAPKTGKKFEPTIMSTNDFNTLYKNVSGTIDEIAIVLAGGLGMRRGEVFGLRWIDVDFKHNTIHICRSLVPTTKGIVEKDTKNISSTRTISVPESLMNVLKQWKEKHLGSERVMNQFNPTSYSQHFKRILERYKLPPMRFHDLRHFNATRMMQLGIADKIASKRLGHSTVHTTREIYQHLLEEIDRTAANKLDDFFK